jgi:pimeloyl-ACP methyl ester carboxylesterase
MAGLSQTVPGAGSKIRIVLRPRVRYATTDDGVAIAYSTVGSGPVTIVLVSPLASQLEVAWEEPALEQFISRLAACSQVVLLDRGSTGLSDRSTAPDCLPGLHDLATDIKAVLDCCGVGAAVLFGVTFGCQLAMQFAADFPARTQALVLAGGWAKLTRLSGFDFEADPGQVDARADRAARLWGSGAMLGAHSLTMKDSARYREWAARLERHTCSPGNGRGIVPVGGPPRRGRAAARATGADAGHPSPG